MNYVDVRGPYPILFQGMIATPLEGYPRSISLADAIFTAWLLKGDVSRARRARMQANKAYGARQP